MDMTFLSKFFTTTNITEDKENILKYKGAT